MTISHVNIFGGKQAIVDSRIIATPVSVNLSCGCHFNISISDLSWHLDQDGYAVSSITTLDRHSRVHVFRMHRVVIGATPGQIVDHVNHDILDNRISNLRICSQSQNIAHSRQRIGKSGYRGVCLKRSRFISAIKLNGNRQSLGTFDTAIEAAKAYDDAARRLFGEFAILDFPETASTLGA